MSFINSIKNVIFPGILFSVSSYILAQDDTIKLYTECNCDKNYIRQEIPYTNHVRDQALADIQLFIFDIGMANGGRSYTLNFMGRNHQFDQMKKEMVYETTPNMTNDEIRKGLVKRIELGLLAYLMKSHLADKIEFEIVGHQEPQNSVPRSKDVWGNWIFQVYGEGEFERETSRSNSYLELGFEGDKVTENWRIRTDVELNESGSMFKRDGEEFRSERVKYAFRGSIVRSLTNHWSLGIFSGLKHDTYNNQDFSFDIRPAIEYNIFPYSEVLRREITFAYKIGYIHNRYLETTIFGEIQEDLFNQSLDLEVRFRQPWGDISANLEASAFLQDFARNRLEFDSNISIRVYKGLAVRLSTNLQLIRDQLTLPAGDASIEDVLLRQRQIATDFETGFAIGISYTFGAAFNNIINTRL
ncbi:hypothetical protein [Ulvibacterium sp.]|uniref:hypothetical protein n=1 Tax=Ulvibacterium sp. TaxID=2665914 RepID=UPI003BA8D343